jgi:hypothetical protein
VSAPSRQDVRARLSSVVGDDEADRVLKEAETAMHVSATWDAAAASAVVGYLTVQPGVIGTAARVFRQRTRSSSGALRAVVGGTTTSETTSSGEFPSGETPISGVSTTPSVPPTATPSSGVKTLLGSNASKVVALLAAGVGEDRARDLVFEALRRRGADPTTLTAEQGLAVLEDLSQTAGPVGTAARFAKARAYFELE